MNKKKFYVLFALFLLTAGGNTVFVLLEKINARCEVTAVNNSPDKLEEVTTGASAERGKMQAALMTNIYGSYDAEKKHSLWNAEKIPHGAELYDFAEGEELYSQIELDTIYTLDSKTYHLILTSTKRIGSSATQCTGVFIYSGSAEEFSPFLKQYYMTQADSWDSALQYRLEWLGKNAVGLVEEWEYFEHGHTVNHYAVYAIHEGLFRQVFKTVTLDTNMSGGEGPPFYEMTAEAAFDKNSAGEYFNILLKTSGTRLNNEGTNAEGINRTETYVFRNGEYVLQ